MAFSFLEYLISVLEISRFCIIEIRKVIMPYGGSTKTAQHSIENNSILKHRSSIQTWNQQCVLQKKENDIYYVVATIRTLLAPVSFWKKPNISICNLLILLGTHMVVILS